MGWRYTVIVLGLMTLIIFCLRYFVFRFHESPKFLLSRGREAEAIEVLHRIAKFNRAPPPMLTVEMFQAIDEMETGIPGHAVDPVTGAAPTRAQRNKAVLKGVGKELARLKGIFTNKLSCFIFVLLAIAYMVRDPCLMSL
jgi:hypothetical protein